MQMFCTPLSGGGGPVTIPPIASYAYNDNDTIWLSTPTTIVSNSVNSSKNYWDIIGYNRTNKNGPFAAYAENRECKTSDDIDDCFIDTTGNAVNFRYTFNQPGYYRLKQVSLNKFGYDTYIDTLYVDTPSSAPIADFFADRRTIGVYDYANMFDLSSNGPTGWYWYLDPLYYNPLAPFFNGFSPSEYSQNPVLNANEGGVFDVCLVASNLRGSDTICKSDYIKIISGYEVCKGSSTSKDTIAYENEGSAKLYTVGDLYLPLLIGSCSKGFTISTCSDTVTLYLDRFKMRSNVTAGVSDSLRIRLNSITGPVIARFGGAAINGSRTVKVPGGVAFLETILVNPSSATPPGDSGYVVRWDAPMATYPKPNAAFSMPDTVYDGYTVQYTNQSTGIKVLYAWDTNGDNVYGIDNPSSGIDSTTTNPTRTFAVFSPYTANICLKAYNCVGADTACKFVRFLPVSAAPSTEFSVNRTSGFTTDTFRFTDLSQNGPNQWEWSFVPNNVAYLGGTDANSQNPILLLNSSSNYDITLTATNQMGSTSKTKLAYVNAIAFGTPGCSGCPVNGSGQPYLPNTIDIGISRVVLNSIDTSTALNTPIYHALYGVKSTTVYRGVSYSVSTSRLTSADPMSTRVWIDFNRNTQYGDEASETIISENNQFKVVTSGSFKVPDAAPVGTTRMRVGITYGNTSINGLVAALGCYEDYGVVVGVDAVKPVITLLGSSLEKVELNKPYTEKGVLGIDNLEGDISSRHQVYGNVDVNKLGYYILKYTVMDLYGNVSDTISRTVQVEINQSGPTLVLNGSSNMDIEVYNSFTDPGATAQSNTGADLTPYINITGSVDTAVLGTYVLTYSITDQFGFNATQYRVVSVTDTTRPQIQTIQGGTTITHQVGTAYADPVTVTDNYWQNMTATRAGLINPNIPGSYNLLYTATDGSGNAATPYAVTVVVKDMIAPDVTLRGDNPMIVDVYTLFVDPGVTATDNYYPNVYPVISNLPNMTALGDYLVTYTVTDGAGNVTEITRLVRVVDRIAPEIEMLGANPFEICRFTKGYVDPGVKLKDNYYTNSTLLNLVQIDTSGLDMTRPGYYLVKYNLTDPSGNKSEQVQRLINVIECLTGLNDELQSKPTLLAFPNPTTGMVSIVKPDNSKITHIKVLDLVGKTIIDKATSESIITLDLSNLNKGIYMVLVEDEQGGTTNTKITVE
jgi:PKD repeat protein